MTVDAFDVVALRRFVVVVLDAVDKEGNDVEALKLAVVFVFVFNTANGVVALKVVVIVDVVAWHTHWRTFVHKAVPPVLK